MAVTAAQESRMDARVPNTDIQVRRGFARLLQVNCRSIMNKESEFWNLIEACDPDVIIGTESWLSDAVANPEIFRSDYITFRRDRETRGGGVFICVKNTFNIRSNWVDKEFEMTGVEIFCSGSILEIIACYRPPGNSYEILGALYERTKNINNRHVVIAGDLNLPDANWKGIVCEGKVQQLVNRLVWDSGLEQVVDRPTRQDAILDICLIRPKDLFLSCDVLEGISDHKAVLVDLQLNISKKSITTGILVKEYKKANVQGFQNYLRERYGEFLRIGGGIDEIWGEFKNILVNAEQAFVPSKLLKSNSDPEYYNAKIRRLKRKTREAFNNRHRSENHMTLFRNYTKVLGKEKKMAEERHLKHILDAEGSNNWSVFFKYVRRRKGSKDEIPVVRVNNSPITDHREKAQAFNAYFSSVFKQKSNSIQIPTLVDRCSFHIDVNTLRQRIKLMKRGKSRGPDGISTDIIKLGGEAILPYLIRLFNVSINNACVPKDWKLALVVPIFKSGDKTIISNYRPVSLTSVVCKLMEHLISSYIRKEWEGREWLYQGQHGFRNGFSCESQLVSLLQDLADVVDEGKRVDAIVIDFSKAFDVVPHDRLIKKLIDSGIDTRVVAWINELLRNRKQKVRIGSNLSTSRSVTSGIPQGSVIGPLMFLAFVNELPTNLASNVRLFADDCVIYRIINSEKDEDILQRDLDKLHIWAETNGMEINSSKSKSITFGRGRSYNESAYKLNNNVIPRVTSCKYLGIQLDSKLSWENQVNFVVGKAWKSLHFVMRILKKSTVRAKELAYMSLVRPILEYGAVCWDPYRILQQRNLEKVQRRASKFTFRGTKNKGVWESLERRRLKSRLYAMYKAYTGLRAWKEIQSRLGKPTYFGRADHMHKIQTRIQKTDVGKYSFANRTIRDWNSLPVTIFDPFPQSLSKFKNKLVS